VGTKFWKGLMDWIKETLVQENKNVSPEDLDLIHLVDNEDEVLEILNNFYNDSELSPNF
jgi:predicted Rossmann-fold nucleotide-binding protein